MESQEIQSSSFFVHQLFEGKTIDFIVTPGQIVKGRIIRSGYAPHNYMSMRRYGTPYYQQQMSYAQNEQPIIEMDGQLHFGLPGRPVFPSLGDGTILKPTLDWQLSSSEPGPLRAELSYVTGGMTWEADYNVIAPETGDGVDLIGWVTMDNQTGKTFQNARIKLMAGDVSKIQPGMNEYAKLARADAASQMVAVSGVPVSERAFDEYHLYTLARPTTLHDRETKQVEFIHAASVPAKRVYVYDGIKVDRNRYAGWSWENFRSDQSYGTQSNPKQLGWFQRFPKRP